MIETAQRARALHPDKARTLQTSAARSGAACASKSPSTAG